MNGLVVKLPPLILIVFATSPLVFSQEKPDETLLKKAIQGWKNFASEFSVWQGSVTYRIWSIEKDDEATDFLKNSDSINKPVEWESNRSAKQKHQMLLIENQTTGADERNLYALNKDYCFHILNDTPKKNKWHLKFAGPKTDLGEKMTSPFETSKEIGVLRLIQAPWAFLGTPLFEVVSGPSFKLIKIAQRVDDTGVNIAEIHFSYSTNITLREKKILVEVENAILTALPDHQWAVSAFDGTITLKGESLNKPVSFRSRYKVGYNFDQKNIPEQINQSDFTVPIPIYAIFTKSSPVEDGGSATAINLVKFNNISPPDEDFMLAHYNLPEWKEAPPPRNSLLFTVIVLNAVLILIAIVCFYYSRKVKKN
ncbi:hypothetical protein [uncultured Gimesia sp.]|uniref:hypothetical protein n=1 Tax=uncultured Gimesia sp. TaxID=1678688 RepID=UPI0030D83F36|tara:strand:+ start:41263 stop:42366 length:1104 start_codon:yes stop_codon:yes gene_type:complete